MKLLLCVSSVKDITPALEHFKVVAQPTGFISPVKILHHEVDILETGAGIFQTSYKVTKAISKQKYHLALKIALGNAYKEETAIGTVFNIVNEKPGDFGNTVDGEWKDLYDLSLLSRHAEPHIRGGFVNLTNAYMNVFAPFKKVVGVTVNNYADKNNLELRKEKYKAECETGDGLGFVYPCLFEKQSFYQLCVTERNLATGLQNVETALKVMNETIIDLINKL
jgi:hypothetical protein